MSSRLAENDCGHYSRTLSESSSGSMEEPGRRQQLETLLEKTDEDVADECFVPSSKTLFYLSDSQSVLSSLSLTDCSSRTEASNGNEFVNVARPVAKSQQTIRPEDAKQWTFVIITTLIAVTCTASPQLVRGVVIPLIAIISLWCCLEFMVLRLWVKSPAAGNAIRSDNVPSLNSVYQLCGYGCIGECIACCFASLFPDYLRSLIVLCSIGLTLSRSVQPSTARISVSVVFIAVCRAAAQCIAVLPALLAPFTVYGLGVIVGIFLEHQPIVPTVQSGDNAAGANPISRSLTDAECAQSRQRRTSIMSLGVGDRTVPVCCTSLTPARGRRTSLPSLSMNSTRHRHSSGSMPSYEAAVIAEAHGIITDMLADGTLLPPHIASGLRAVASLLEQPSIGTPSSASARQRNGPFVSLSEVCSDTEESPFTGERPNVLPKRFRRSLPLSLLRRMSTSTWTTTTSATGLPTLEPEPSRKRSTSFRTSPVSSPSGSRSQSPSPACSPNPAVDIIMPKQRSLSTIIPSRGSPVLGSFNNRKYHRSTIGSISVPEGVLSKSVTFNLEPTNLRTDAHMLSEESRPAEKTHLSPAIRRINLTSDYESSESPSNSEHDESTALLDELAAQSAAPAADAAALVPEDGSEVEEEDLIPGRHYRVGNITYDLEAIDEHPLLNHLSEWDFPVFDLYNEMGDRILSQVAYKIFQDVGLFDTFRIPVQEFLNYFHTLEMGYRDKPYHNRIHAADVLHGVYFLSSQPIPGFIQIPWHDTPKAPKSRPNTDVSAGDALPNLRLQYANGSAENDIYGIMGCNLPPLELMALYAAAAIHDYDHPGRTNAFLVATNAPQAVLYNDRSVLENHHAAAAWRLLLCKPEFNWLCHLEKAEWKRFRYLVIEAVLATDLKRHFEIIAEFNSKASDDDAPGLDWTNETDRLMACQMCIKLADINGPCKRKDLHLQWTYRITEEFFEQGDEEASLGLPISPYMDRNNPQLARLQESFINHLVAPLCNAYGEAGLLPGRWRILDEPEERSNESSRKTSLETGAGASIPEDSVADDPPAERIPLPRIECLLTEHIKSNHDMWVIKVKEEERLKAEKADWDSKNSSRKNSAEEP